MRISRNSFSRRCAVAEDAHRRCCSAIACRTAGKYLFMKNTVMPRRLQTSLNDGAGLSPSAAAAFLSRAALHSIRWALCRAESCSHRSGSRARKTLELEQPRRPLSFVSVGAGCSWRASFQSPTHFVGFGKLRQRNLFADCPTQFRILLMDVSIVRVAARKRSRNGPLPAGASFWCTHSGPEAFQNRCSGTPGHHR